MNLVWQASWCWRIASTCPNLFMSIALMGLIKALWEHITWWERDGCTMVVVQLFTYSVPLYGVLLALPSKNLRICFLALPSVEPTLSTNPSWFMPQFHSHRSFLMVSTWSRFRCFFPLEITKAEIFSKIHCLALISKVLTAWRLKGLSIYQMYFR